MKFSDLQFILKKFNSLLQYENILVDVEIKIIGFCLFLDLKLQKIYF